MWGMKKILCGVAAVLVAALPVRYVMEQRAKAAEQVRAERFADDQARIYLAAQAEMRGDQRRKAANEKILRESRENVERLQRSIEEGQRRVRAVRE